MNADIRSIFTAASAEGDRFPVRSATALVRPASRAKKGHTWPPLARLVWQRASGRTVHSKEVRRLIVPI